MTKDEALKRGMELLRSNISAQQWFELQPEITAIKEALAQRKPLTDEEIEEIAARTLFPINFARAIEAKLKENT